MSRFIVTIDGPAGAGKSTTARALAQRLGFVFLDTGAIYRAVALLATEAGAPLDSDDRLEEICQRVDRDLTFKPGATRQEVWLAGRDISDAIRTPEVGQAASIVSARPVVRAGLLELQRTLAGPDGVVAEGRDAGTVVFPNADAKFFLDASPAERARRRAAELVSAGRNVSREDMLREMGQRDTRDTQRAVAPLRPAADAVLVDTSNLTVEQVVDRLEAEILRRRI